LIEPEAASGEHGELVAGVVGRAGMGNKREDGEREYQAWK
jgi:hypothetical protein